jgi:hypothetical protein
MTNGSSPHKARNYHGIINSVLEYLHNQKNTGNVVILVEGLDDKEIYSNFFVPDIVYLRHCTGKSDLQRSLSGLLDKTNQVIGIRDADFCNLENIKPENQNLFFTDFHDIEMTMLYFEEIRRNLFSEYGDWDKIDSIWEFIIKKASYAGYVRWFNEKNNLEISFGNNIYYKIEYNDNREQTLLDMLNEQSPNKKKPLTIEMINDFISAYKTDDFFNLCNGHDVTTLIVLVLKDKTRRNISQEDCSNILRKYFHLTHFMQTRLYGSLLAWQRASGFDILKTAPGAANG